MTRMLPRSLLPLLVAAVVVCGVTVASAAPETRSHPLGITLDDQVSPSSVYVRFTAERFDEPFDAWAARNPFATDDAGRAFVALVRALRSDDAEAARRLLDPRRLGEATPKWMVTFLRQGWDDLSTVQMIARLRHAGDEVFIFRVNSSEGWWVRSLAFTEYMGRWQGRATTGMDPALSLINDALTHAALAPSRYPAVAATGAGYAVPLDTEKTVFLEFDGRRTVFDAADGAPQTEAGALFQQGMRLLARSAWAEYEALYTPLSARKIKDGVAAQDPGTHETSGPILSQGVVARFEMDLGPPGVLIFYAQGNVEGKRALRSQYVARTPQGWRLSNFFKTYALRRTLMRAPTWPKYAAPFEQLLDASRRGGTTP